MDTNDININELAEGRLEAWGELYDYSATDELWASIVEGELLPWVRLLFDHGTAIARDIRAWASVNPHLPEDEALAALEAERLRQKDTGLIEDGHFGENSVPQTLLRLSVYAACGVQHEGDRSVSADKEAQTIAANLDIANGLRDSIPTAWQTQLAGSDGYDARDNNVDDPIARLANLPILPLISAANARFEIDTLLPVSRHGLAILAGVKLKSIQNAVASGAMKADGDGLIEWKSAKQFLDGRRDWLPSIWRNLYDAGEVTANSMSTPDEEQRVEEPVHFVPRARDGSEYLPYLKRRRGYQVGGKGNERYVSDNFFEALRELQSMVRPAWRRPNDQGAWGAVTAVEWSRYTESELRQLLDDLAEK